MVYLYTWAFGVKNYNKRTEMITNVDVLNITVRYFQHAYFMPIVGVGKRGEY